MQELIEDLKNKNSSSEHIVEEMRSSIEELESTLEQVSIEYGDVEEKWKESENLLEETSLAMDDLRLKLNEEREKVKSDSCSHSLKFLVKFVFVSRLTTNNKPTPKARPSHVT